MRSTPWITFEASPGGNTLKWADPGLQDLIAKDDRPCIITVVGKRSKTTFIEGFIGGKSIVPVHRDIHLCHVPSSQTRGDWPYLIVDCGVQNAHYQPPNPAADCSRTEASWVIPEIRNLNAALCGRLLWPFSTVICCFVNDLGGPRTVARWLAELGVANRSDIPTRPRILLVIETTSDTFDEKIAANKATVLLQQALDDLKTDFALPDKLYDIESRLGPIEVLGLHSYKSNAVRVRVLKRRLLAMSEASLQQRVDTHTHFRYHHFLALSKASLSQLSKDHTVPLPFAAVSRPEGFTNELMSNCISDFLDKLPSQAWLWHFAAPLIASALLLASYPPGAHGKPSYDL